MRRLADLKLIHNGGQQQMGGILTSTVLQVSGEDGLAQGRLDIVEEGLLRGRRDRVEAAEGQAEQAVGAVGLELRRDLLGALDSLLLEAHASHGHDVGVDVAAGAGLVAVGNAPGSTRQSLGRARLGRVVLGVTAASALGLGREHPEVRRAGIEVQVQGLSRGTDLHGCEVLAVVLGRGVGGRASVAAALGGGLAARDGGGHVVGHRLAELDVSAGKGGGAVSDQVRVGDSIDREVLDGGADLGRDRGREASGGEEGDEESSEGLHGECLSLAGRAKRLATGKRRRARDSEDGELRSGGQVEATLGVDELTSYRKPSRRGLVPMASALDDVVVPTGITPSRESSLSDLSYVVLVSSTKLEARLSRVGSTIRSGQCTQV